MADPIKSAYGGGESEPELQVRCWRCGRLIAELLTKPWRIKCSRCKAINQSAK